MMNWSVWPQHLRKSRISAGLVLAQWCNAYLPLMATYVHHAESSARKYGGKMEDYIDIHKWIDAPKEHRWHFVSRIFRHSTLAIGDAEAIFGLTIENSNGKQVLTRLIVEQHLMEDFGFIPTPDKWLQSVKPEPWMTNGAEKLSKKIELTP